MTKKNYIGKTVKSIRRVKRGHYDQIEYHVRFTDGTGVSFAGYSNACVYMKELTQKKVGAEIKQ